MQAHLTKPGTGKKVVVAMSGGVDSSAAAALLKQDGYEVVGCFMRLGSPDEAEVADGYDNLHNACDTDPGQSSTRSHKQGCCSVNDAADARLVAATLGVPFYVVNFRRDFGRIMDYFGAEYNAGRTPIPCVRSVDWLKFGRLHAYAKSIDADFVASGHYAQVVTGPDGHALKRGVDQHKDQSYVLFGAHRDLLPQMLLPVGGLEKPVVRQIAEDFNLPVFNKPDSQEICFVPDQDYAALVKRRTPDGQPPGAILDEQGQTLGEHPGHQHFTVGQRRGLNLPAQGPVSIPLYVLSRDAQANTVTVGPRDALASIACTARETNWLVADPPRDWTPCYAKARYNSQPTPAAVRARPGDDWLEVRFDQPLDALTPGQAVVCYDAETGDTVLGGGWIDTVTPAGSA